jgi:adenylyltransferase/sulfurtransferase
MPNVGSVGQRKLLDGKVLIIGAGGLGSPIALYLALAGVGKLGIVDFDTVDVSNLQRQILHTDADVGKRKVISAKETLLAHNPDIDVEIHEEPINSENAMQIISDYDIIVNGADNFSTRYLVNDAAYLAVFPDRAATAACTRIPLLQAKSRTAQRLELSVHYRVSSARSRRLR